MDKIDATEVIEFTKKFDEISGAIFSENREHRFCLWRRWDKSKPMIMFIGLNPSTANETTADPTIRRVVHFAKAWGYGGVFMVNLYTVVSSKPEVLKTHPKANLQGDFWLTEISKLSARIVFAWGSFKEAKERGDEVWTMFPHSYCLAVNKDRSPKHPLYVRGDKLLEEYQG